MNPVIVFKTSVSTPANVSELSVKLNRLIREDQWNFDLEDCDNILRVESNIEVTHDIIRLLNENGFECAELDG